ncbi:MAG TPA: glycosyltransferase family 2 protein, partial [Candidatus Limnocylindrales bacterium]|nr:glycosyltransferase family 2 protein [Candidatus Limnocylindrales bacterium]
MDDRPLLSVIVPAWNVGPSLERAVRSALAEPVNLEVVVVDDGSTDDTLAVARAIAAGDPRVVVVAQPANAGVSEARNLALERARGTWLTFLDADDVLLPGGLVALLTAAERDDALVVVGQRRWSDGERTWRSAAYDIPDVRRPGRGSLASRPDLVAYASATGKLFAAELVSGLRFRGRILGDQPWTVRALIRAGDRLTVIDDDVYLWLRPLPGTISASLTASKVDASGPATEAVRVAIGALAEVTAEASQIADPSTRRRVVGAYFER